MTWSTPTRTYSSARSATLASPYNLEIQTYGVTQEYPSAPDQDVRNASINGLNQILADTITLCDMYKKHHWQGLGPVYYPLHLLFDEQFAGQFELVEQIIERIMDLGGSAAAMACDAAETTRIPRMPQGRDDPTTEISRLLRAHEIILDESRALARQASKQGDDETHDLIVSGIISTNETQQMLLYVYLAQDNL